jgi:hypothetical protein
VRTSEKYEVRHPAPSRGQRTKRSGAIRNPPSSLSGRRSFLLSYDMFDDMRLDVEQQALSMVVGDMLLYTYSSPSRMRSSRV